MSDARASHRVRRFKIHRATGVLMTFMVDLRIEEHKNPDFEPYGEPQHVLLRNDIGNGPDRRRGVWQYASNDSTSYGSRIYFTCPHCGAIGVSHTSVGGAYADSVVCGFVERFSGYEPIRKKGCGRHLSLHYRDERDKEEGYWA